MNQTTFVEFNPRIHVDIEVFPTKTNEDFFPELISVWMNIQQNIDVVDVIPYPCPNP